MQNVEKQKILLPLCPEKKGPLCLALECRSRYPASRKFPGSVRELEVGWECEAHFSPDTPRAKTDGCAHARMRDLKFRCSDVRRVLVRKGLFFVIFFYVICMWRWNYYYYYSLIAIYFCLTVFLYSFDDFFSLSSGFVIN